MDRVVAVDIDLPAAATAAPAMATHMVGNGQIIERLTVYLQPVVVTTFYSLVGWLKTCSTGAFAAAAGKTF